MAQLIHGTTINGHIAIHAGNLVDHSIATTTYVNTQIANLVNSAPAALDTLNELAAALGNNASFSTTVTNSLAGKLSLTGGTLTGALNIDYSNAYLYIKSVNNGNGVQWHDQLWLGRYDSIQTASQYPNYLPGAAYGLHITQSSDALFVGLISRGSNSNDYNAVIAWGDDAGDVLQFRFNNGVIATLSDGGSFNAANLTINSAQVATQSWVGSQGYLTSGSLSGYATQSWVNSQGFLTSLPSHNHDDRYYTEGESDSRFTRNLGQQVNVGNLNDLDGAYTVNLDGYGPINGYGGPDNAYNASLWGIGNSGRGAQIYLPYAYDQMYFRRGAGGWSSWFRVLNTSADPYPSAMNQYVRSSDSPTFANLTVSGGGAYYGSHGAWTGDYNKIQWHSNHLYLQNTAGGYFIYRRADGTNLVHFDNSGNIFPSAQTSYYLYQANSGLWTNGNFGASGDLYLGTRSTWLSSWLNQSVQTGAGPTFSSVTVNGVVGNWGGQTRDKLRVWDGSSYTIGMKSGYDYGHLGNDEYAMSFQMNNNSGRGFWWGDDAHNDDQGAASLTTDGRMVIAKSLSIGEGETVVSPSSIPLYVVGTTSGSDVFAVDGVNGRLFSVTDDLSDSLFSVNTIAGLPVIEAYANNVVTIGKFGTNAIYVGTDGRVGFGTTDFSYTASDNTAVVSSNPTNNRVFVNGSIQLLGNNDAIVFGRGTGSFLKDEELAFGWGGGWYMTDGSYIRSRGSKSLHMNTASVDYVGSLYLESGGQGAHLQPNTSGSYGSLQVTSSRNSWSGIYFTASGNTLMMNNNESGHYQQGNGWKWRWYQGTLYVSRSTYGGGTEYTVWDSGNLTNLNQLSNGPGYITSSSLSGYATQSWVQSQGYITSGSFLSSNNDSEQTAGVNTMHWNLGGNRVYTDPRWNESGYDADLGTLHIYSTTASGVNYGRAGIALYNGSAYQYLTTRGGTTGIFLNNTQIVTNSGTWSINISGDAATLSGRSVGNSTGNVAYFDGSRNLYVNNPESYSGEVRLGAAWGRGGVYASSTLSLSTSASEIHFVFGNGVPIKVNSSGSLIGDGTVTLSGKSHYLGVSGGWDGVGFGNLTNLHFQGHTHFWIGAGNAYWYRGGINTEHDLLITTMYGYDSQSYYRGITFGVENNGNGSSGNYRLGRWQTYGTGWTTARLQVDASLSVGYGARGTRAYDEAKYPLDRGVWAHGRDQAGYGSDRIRDHIFSPTANGGGTWGSFASLEVSSIYEGNSDIPALFRMHQWGSGAAEFWKPQGTVLYLRESPGGGGSWFTQFQVQGSTYVTSSMQAYSYQGHSNVAGTGNASYHPSGIYSTGTNWLYGTMYLNNNSIQDAANIYNSGWYRNYNQTGLYSQTYDNHFASYDTNYWRLASAAGLEVWSKGFGAIKGYVYFDGSSFGLLNSSGQWAVRTYGGSETQLMWNGSWRGIAQSNGFRVNGNLYIDVDYGYGVVGVYTSTRYQGVFAMGDSYKLAADGSSTGSLYGLAWSHPNAGGVAGNLNTHGLLVMENGTFLAAVSGSIRARDDMRAPALYDSGSRVAISRGEGRNYVDYSRYVYNNGAYSGSGWIEPSDLGVRYAYYGRLAYNNGAYSGSGWVEPSDLGVRYASSSGSTDRLYPFGAALNDTHPGYGLRAWYDWAYSGTYRNGISLGSNPGDQAYGWQLWQNMWDDRTYTRRYNSGWQSTRTLLTAQDDPYAYNMNQYVRTSDSPSFSTVYVSSWFRTYGYTGLYSQDYGSHIRPTENAAHGTWEIFGYNKGGYAGLNIQDSSGYYNNYMHEGGNGGLYQQNGSGWIFYWYRPNGCLGLGTSSTSGSYRVYVGGSLYAEGDIVAYSDARKKTDIITIDNALDKVLQLRGVYYTRIDAAEKGRQTGVIAQEINEVLPEVVTYASDIDEYGVSYGNIAGVLIEAIKEQQQQIADLKEEIKKLKGE